MTDDTYAIDGGSAATKWQQRHAKREEEGSSRMSKPVKSVVRTSAGLRDALFDALDSLRNGEIEPGEAKATATVAQQIINTVQLELDVHKMRREYPSDAKVIIPVPLDLSVPPPPTAARIEKK